MSVQPILNGIKVADFSRHLPGPLATLLLADLGAAVVKVEAKNYPDPVRFLPPFVGGHSTYYAALNRNKQSIVFDFQSSSGKKALKDLAAWADIVVELFRPGMMAQWGMDYETLHQINPRLIYVSVTGYGQTGDLSAFAGHDLNYLSQAGVLSLNTLPDGRPLLPAFQLADVMGGSYPTMNACLLGLWQREQTGLGDHFNVSMTDHLLPLLALPLAMAHGTDGQFNKDNLQLLAGKLPNYNVYRCADGQYMALAALEPKFWKRFCEAVARTEWINRLFSDNDRLHEDLTHLFAEQPRTYWEVIARQTDCCLSPVYEVEEVMQKGERLNGFTAHTYGEQTIQSVRLPTNFSTTPLATSTPAPDLGADTAAFFTQLGYTAADLQGLL